MKTYAEVNGKEPFDWNSALDNAIKHGTSQRAIDRDIMLEASAKWVTCACGNQCASIPRVESGTLKGMPLDELLSHLGGVFYDYIAEENYVEAKQVLRDIEQRSIEIINEINNS